MYPSIPTVARRTGTGRKLKGATAGSLSSLRKISRQTFKYRTVRNDGSRSGAIISLGNKGESKLEKRISAAGSGGIQTCNKNGIME